MGKGAAGAGELLGRAAGGCGCVTRKLARAVYAVVSKSEVCSSVRAESCWKRDTVGFRKSGRRGSPRSWVRLSGVGVVG